MADALLDRQPVEYESALAAAVDKVFTDKGLTFEAAPRWMSPADRATDISAALLGAEMMGYPLTPQGIHIAAMLEAKSDELDPISGLHRPLYEECTVEIPRRSTKTTTIQMVLLGRCTLIPGYRVVSTAQDGTRASQFFMNMVRMIEGVLRRSGRTEKDLGIKQIYRSQGREFIEWYNGSRWWVVKPESGAFRGEAADAMWFDEAGELNAAQAEDLVAGAFPLMDTRPLGQIIISGTPGPVRAGVFWDALKRGREDSITYGIVDFCATDGADIFDEDLWWVTHPGLACGLTTIAKLRRNLDKLGPAKFAQEYLCIWAPDTTQSAIDPEAWNECTEDPAPFTGQDFDLTYDCHIHGLYATLTATWVDGNGEPCGQVMDFRPGTEWLVAELTRAQKAHPRVKIHYDSIGANSAVALQLQRVPTFRPHALHPVTMKEVAAGASILSTALEGRTAHIAASASLTNAAENVTWRYSGESRLFGRKNASVDVSGIVSLSIGMAQSMGRKAQSKRKRAAAVIG
jgi:hypothetical protein